MKDLKEIGFYTLSDDRARTISEYSQMQRCELIITEYCNFRCPYCRGLKSEIYQDRQNKQLTLDEIKSIIDIWCKDKPLKNIRFSGGEPTIHPNIVEIIGYAKDKGIERIAISTNGSADWSLYEKLVNVGCNDFSVSLDGCCASDINKMAGVSNVDLFAKISSNIRGLSTLTYVTVGIVLTPDNVNKTIDTIMYADSLGVSDIRIISAAQ